MFSGDILQNRFSMYSEKLNFSERVKTRKANDGVISLFAIRIAKQNVFLKHCAVARFRAQQVLRKTELFGVPVQIENPTTHSEKFSQLPTTPSENAISGRVLAVPD
jgi:hypothetical protein